ncbi:MAG: hypothetical protein P8X91_05070 [Candidatus Bathyarchaeota archaeon]
MNPSGIIYIEYGESQTITISPSSGYYITDVFVDGNSVGALNSYTFTLVESNHTISANFAAKFATYDIKVNSPFGSPTPSTQVNAGESLFVSVTTPVGDTSHRWICTGYSIDNAATIMGNNYTFVNVQSDHNITFFWEEQFYVTVILQNGSTDESGWYNKDSKISIPESDNTLELDSGTRNIFSGWTFSSWTGDLIGSINSSNLIIDGNKDVTATFSFRMGRCWKSS